MGSSRALKLSESDNKQCRNPFPQAIDYETVVIFFTPALLWIL